MLAANFPMYFFRLRFFITYHAAEGMYGAEFFSALGGKCRNFLRGCQGGFLRRSVNLRQTAGLHRFAGVCGVVSFFWEK